MVCFIVGSDRERYNMPEVISVECDLNFDPPNATIVLAGYPAFQVSMGVYYLIQSSLGLPDLVCERP